MKFPTEIVSAKVKIDPVGLITAFGQACAYRLFGRIFGIGLILFNAKDPQNPSLELRVRAAKNEPDMSDAP